MVESFFTDVTLWKHFLREGKWKQRKKARGRRLSAFCGEPPSCLPTPPPPRDLAEAQRHPVCSPPLSSPRDPLQLWPVISRDPACRSENFDLLNIPWMHQVPMQFKLVIFCLPCKVTQSWSLFSYKMLFDGSQLTILRIADSLCQMLFLVLGVREALASRNLLAVDAEQHWQSQGGEDS